MKYAKKLAALLIAAALVFSLAACTQQAIVETEEEVKTTEAPKEETTKATEKETEKTDDGNAETDAPEPANNSDVDLSETVNLVVYMVGEEPEDVDTVEAAINEKLLEKFNTTIEFQFSTWTDYKNKYNNMLTTHGADLAYTAMWMDYQTLADVGAFMELDDLMPKYAPELYEACGEGALNSCRVNGKLYCFPNLWPEYVNQGIAWRHDLAEKYNIPDPIDSMENVEGYFQGLIDNGYEGGILYNLGSGASVGTYATSASALLRYNHPGKDALSYGFMYDMDNPRQLVDYWHSDEFVEDMKLMKKWADAGWWSRSFLSAENDTDALVHEKTTAIIDGTNANKWVSWCNSAKSAGFDDWEIGWWEYANMDNNAYPAHPTQNATVIVNGCKYPERALMVVNYIMMDKEMNDLVQCGIEGVHYTLDEKGFYHAIENSGYGYEACDTWNWRNGDFKLQQETDVQLQKSFDHSEELGSHTLYPNVNITQGFNESYIDYEAERTAVANVCDQYLNPLFGGLVDDVDAAVAEFLEKVDAAGLQVCADAYKAQWEAYCDEFGYTASR